ncbi:unnamed protein product [Anisakis simplex]|uniref:Importin subunit alpha (inferred by orthology to a D. melanogaster protein) n=1 Tax=Anisakis simplex TaxID=6269 RepID=A0A0M3K220_ANISI|nr:unnamed protein product [Anisakis simplex]
MALCEKRLDSTYRSSVYKLYYFTGRGRGEHIRQILRLAGVPFDDIILTPESWPKYRNVHTRLPNATLEHAMLFPEMPLGQVPVLEVDGVRIAQSVAIARFLGHKFRERCSLDKLDGRDDLENAQLDMVADLISDAHNADGIRQWPYVLLRFKKKDKAEFFKRRVQPALAAFAPLIEQFLERNPHGFLIGNKVTWVDVFAAEFFSKFVDFGEEGCLDAHPSILAHIDRIHSLPPIRDHLNNRLPTLWELVSMVLSLYTLLGRGYLVGMFGAEVSSVLQKDGSNLNMKFSANEADNYLKMMSDEHSVIAQACAVEYFRRLLVYDGNAAAKFADTLIKELVRCVRINYGFMQRDAAWALTNLACCPHEYCQKIISFEGVDALVDCARNTDEEVREQAFWAIGNIASDCVICRMAVRQTSALATMINVIHRTQFLHSRYRRNLVWAMAQILRGGSMHIPPAVNMILEMPGLLERLMVLLDDPITVAPALRVIGNIVAGDDDQTQVVLDAAILPKLGQLLKNCKGNVQRKELIWIISNIAAGTPSQIDTLFDSRNGDFVTLIIEAARGDDMGVKKEAGWAVANALTGASVSKTHWLCASNILLVPPLVLRPDMDSSLLERMVYALEIVTRRCTIYLPLFNRCGIIDALSSLLCDGDHIDTATRR